MNLVSKYLFKLIFLDFFIKYESAQENFSSIMQITQMPEFLPYATNKSFIIYSILVLLINILIMAGYFIGFWIYISATPGKFMMSTKIVDAVTFEKPTNRQFIKRFFFSFFFFVGIWFIQFTKQRQALHDKMSGTLVIKK